LKNDSLLQTKIALYWMKYRSWKRIKG